MRIIALMPVRNEAWIIDRTLKTLASFCDVIIVADHRSTDGTREILARHAPKVVMLDNPYEFHTTRIRWDLLEAARQFEGDNFLLFTDADEILSANILGHDVVRRLHSLEPGTSIVVELVNLWRSSNFWRNDTSLWTGRWMEIGFHDDRNVRYGLMVDTLDHNKRIPQCARTTRIEDIKLLHFQFVLFERMLAKQRWYRACEAVQLGPSAAEEINVRYGVTRDERHVEVSPIWTEWTSGWKDIGVDLEHFEEPPPSWYETEVLRYFAEKGTAYFAAIDLWDVDWEEKRGLAKADGIVGVPDTPIVDPRSQEQRLYHAYLHRFFRTPFWRDPEELLRMPARWLRSSAKAAGLRRQHLEWWQIKRRG